MVVVVVVVDKVGFKSTKHGSGKLHDFNVSTLKFKSICFIGVISISIFTFT